MKEINILKKSIDDSNFSNKEELLSIIRNLEGNLKNKKYGLVWEEKTENIKEELKNKFIYLEEEVDKRISKCNDKPENILIEGDNLEGLMTLQYTHKNSIDVIYIDPPYNTENKDFKYNDTFIDKDNQWRHSCWLSFMNKRLKLAKELLSDNGVIFISIDDNEQAQLKLLCDEVFGEENFVANIAVELSKTQGMKVRSAQQGNIVKNHEYILAYSKTSNSNARRMPLYDSATPYDEHFDIILTKTDNGYLKEDLIDFLKRNQEVSRLFNLLNMPISKKNIEKAMSLSKEFNDYMIYEISKILYRTSMIKSTEIQSLEINVDEVFEYKKYLLIKNRKGTIEQLQCFADTLKLTDEYIPVYSRATIRGALWKGFYSDMMNISKEGNIEFKNGKKPVRLIQQLLKWATFYNKDAVILDFFAGSGTTGHAVMELNKIDNGNRRFILCTNNENNICREVTYKRLNNVCDKNPFNLRYYKTQKIEKTSNNELDQFNLLNKTLELIQIKENAFEIVKSNSYYSLLSNSDKIVGLYSFGFIDSIEIENMLDELINNNKNKVAYVPVEDISEIYDYIDSKYIGLVQFKKMPKELIEIYNKLNRN